MEIGNVDNSIINRYTEIVSDKKEDVKESNVINKKDDVVVEKEVEKSSLGSNIDIIV